MARAEGNAVAPRVRLDGGGGRRGGGALGVLCAGTMGSVDARGGERVSPGVVVVRIADLSAWRLETENLDELSVVNLRENDRVTVTFDALPELEIVGTVVSIGAFGEEKQGAVTYTAVIDLEKHDERLRWNMTAAITKRRH